MVGEALSVDEPYLAALSRKAQAFADLLSLSRGQDAVLGEEDPEALLALLARKKGLIERIEGIDRDLASARPAAPGRPADPRAQALLQGIRETLAQIVACEEETRRRVDSMKRQTLEEITRIRQGRRAAELYRRPPQGGAALDRED